MNRALWPVLLLSHVVAGNVNSTATEEEDLGGVGIAIAAFVGILVCLCGGAVLAWHRRALERAKNDEAREVELASLRHYAQYEKEAVEMQVIREKVTKQETLPPPSPLVVSAIKRTDSSRADDSPKSASIKTESTQTRPEVIKPDCPKDSPVLSKPRQAPPRRPPSRRHRSSTSTTPITIPSLSTDHQDGASSNDSFDMGLAPTPRCVCTRAATLSCTFCGYMCAACFVSHRTRRYTHHVAVPL